MDYEFTTTLEIIKELESIRNSLNHAWIFKDGKINEEEIYTCDIVDCLKNITNHEVEVDTDEFDNVYGMTHGFEDMKCYNTYNYNGNASEVIEYHIYDEGFNFYVMMAFHRGGDVRGNYTNWVLYKFDGIDEFCDAFHTTYAIETDEWDARVICTPWSEWNDTYVMMKNSDETFDLELFECEPKEIIKSINESVNNNQEVKI